MVNFSLRDEEEDEEVEQIQIADMEALKTTLEELSAKIKELEQKQNSTTATEIKIATTIPLPKPINITEGNVKTNFKFFATQWKEYLTASGLGSSNEAVKKATLLSAIGEECLRVYENLPLTEDEKKIGKHVARCTGEAFGTVGECAIRTCDVQPSETG